MRVLVLNAGSSSLKASLLAGPDDNDGLRWELERAPGPDAWTDALAAILSETGTVDAVGHRVVHGGTRHTTPKRIDDDVVAELDALRAQLHQRVAELVEPTCRRLHPQERKPRRAHRDATGPRRR